MKNLLGIGKVEWWNSLFFWSVSGIWKIERYGVCGMDGWSEDNMGDSRMYLIFKVSYLNHNEMTSFKVDEGHSWLNLGTCSTLSYF